MERSLGIQWCAEKDQFKFKIELKDRIVLKIWIVVTTII